MKHRSERFKLQVSAALEVRRQYWSRFEKTPEDFSPKGDFDLVREAIAPFNVLQLDGSPSWDEIEKEAMDAAAVYLWFDAAKAGAPTREEVSERLASVEAKSRDLLELLLRLDDISVDYLTGNNQQIGRFSKTFATGVLASSEAFRKALSASFGPVVTGRDARCLPGGPFDAARDILLAGPVARLSALGDIAAMAKAAFADSRPMMGGQAALPLTSAWGTPKRCLVDQCALLIHEFCGDAGLAKITGGYDKKQGSGRASFASLARAMFAFATGKDPDESGNSLERAVGDVAKDWGVTRNRRTAQII